MGKSVRYGAMAQADRLRHVTIAEVIAPTLQLKPPSAPTKNTSPTDSAHATMMGIRTIRLEPSIGIPFGGPIRKWMRPTSLWCTMPVKTRRY